MPRYLIVAEACTPTAMQRAVGVLGARFPEISLESQHITNDNQTHMLCSAPSAEHARRWLRSADICVDSITAHPRHRHP